MRSWNINKRKTRTFQTYVEIIFQNEFTTKQFFNSPVSLALTQLQIHMHFLLLDVFVVLRIKKRNNFE